jgi:hypothetical protein
MHDLVLRGRDPVEAARGRVRACPDSPVADSDRQQAVLVRNAGDSLWVDSYDASTVWRIDPGAS